MGLIVVFDFEAVFGRAVLCMVVALWVTLLGKYEMCLSILQRSLPC